MNNTCRISYLCAKCEYRTCPPYEKNRTTHSLDPVWENLKHRLMNNLFGSKGADVNDERDD